VKTPYGASDDEKAVALARLSWAVGRIRAGESFAEVARETSDDTGSAAQGGDVGDKTSGFVPPFRGAADALKPGEMTAGAVETQFGFHVILRDDPARAADVAAQVKRGAARAAYAKSRGTEATRLVATRIQALMAGGKSSDDAIQSVTADYVVARPGKIERLKVLPGPPTGTDDAGASDAEPASGAADAGPSKARRAPKAGTAEALPEKLFDATTDSDRPQAQTSSEFNRGGDPFAGLSPDGTTTVVTFAFSSKDGDVLPEPVRTQDSYAVVQLKQHKAKTREEFEKDRATFEQELVRAKRDEALSLYVKRLREQAKDAIKVDDSYVQEARADGGATGPADEEEEY
jgi:peptidyl-prolyl cis-trans isomerase D